MTRSPRRKGQRALSKNPPAPFSCTVIASPLYRSTRLARAGLDASRFIFLFCIVGSARGKAPRHQVTKRVRKHAPQCLCGIPVAPIL